MNNLSSLADARAKHQLEGSFKIHQSIHHLSCDFSSTPALGRVVFRRRGLQHRNSGNFSPKHQKIWLFATRRRAPKPRDKAHRQTLSAGKVRHYLLLPSSLPWARRMDLARSISLEKVLRIHMKAMTTAMITKSVMSIFISPAYA